MNIPLLTYIDEISPRPILVIAGSEAHSRLQRNAVAAASDPKELVVIEGADHVDLYDPLDIIPFDRQQAFFKKHLSA